MAVFASAFLSFFRGGTTVTSENEETTVSLDLRAASAYVNDDSTSSPGFGASVELEDKFSDSGRAEGKRRAWSRTLAMICRESLQSAAVKRTTKTAD
jgi:hypothetical protein